jgi:hypothetical protein
MAASHSNPQPPQAPQPLDRARHRLSHRTGTPRLRGNPSTRHLCPTASLRSGHLVGADSDSRFGMRDQQSRRVRLARARLLVLAQSGTVSKTSETAAFRTNPPPLQPRQPPHQRHPAPDGRRPVALRAARPGVLRARGHTKKDGRRILKRHLSDVVYRRMIRDLAAQTAQRGGA